MHDSGGRARSRVGVVVLATLFMVISAAIIGTSAVVATIGQATIKALARNPSSSPTLLIGMIVILIFNQAIVVVSLLVFFQIFNKMS